MPPPLVHGSGANFRLLKESRTSEIDIEKSKLIRPKMADTSPTSAVTANPSSDQHSAYVRPVYHTYCCMLRPTKVLPTNAESRARYHGAQS